MNLLPKLDIKQKINSNLEKMKENISISKEINKLSNDWKDLMYELGLHTNTFNIFTLLNITKQPYGYSCNIYATKGLNLEDLEKAKPYIETGLGCIFIFNVKQKGSKIAEAKFVTNGFGGDDIKFTPPKTSPFELYIGNSVDGKPVIISSKKVSHFLLSGSNGGGKSRMLDCMISTLIYNCNESELELYLCQIAKNDLVIYEDAKVCRAFCDTLENVEIMLNHIMGKMKERDKLIKPMRKAFKGSDITDYNRIHPDRKLSVCWIIFDEIASIMDKTGDDKNTKNQKNKIIAMTEEIARVGRALGIFLGVCIQKPTAEMLSPTVKSQTNLRISFSQNNQKSSEVAMDDPYIALGLPDRIAVYSCRGGDFDFVKTPYIDDKTVEKYVASKYQSGHRNLFSDLRKLKKDIRNQENKHKATQKSSLSNGKAPIPINKDENSLTFDIIDKIGKEPNKPIVSICNSPDFVPYNPPDKNTKVIDKTDTKLLLKSEESKKKGKVKLPNVK